MSLLEELRLVLSEPELPSFRVYGEDLVVLGPERLERAAQAYAAAVEQSVPPSLRERLIAERVAILKAAHAYLARHNVGIHARIRGYLELGRRLDFHYPWPVVAILGIGEVLRTITRVHLFGLVGSALERFGQPALLELAEKSDDVLRRTNRGIFADSVPTVLYALRVSELEKSGSTELARALLSGPPPIWMDQESLAIARGLVEGLALGDGERRFAALSELTLRHFAREQAIFTFHMGGHRSATAGSRRSFAAALFEAKSVSAPRIAHTRRGPRLVYAPYRLPAGFSMRDHGARVQVFGDAFVRSITQSPSDYRAAVEWVERRYG